MKTLAKVTVIITFVLTVLLVTIAIVTEDGSTVGELVLLFGLTFLIPLFLVVWFLSVRQEVVIDEEGISVQQHALMWKPKNIAWSEVKSAHVRPMNAFGEFGGWGIRYALKGKWGYILDGDHGVDLLMHSRKHLVVSIVDAEGARSAVLEFAPRS